MTNEEILSSWAAKQFEAADPAAMEMLRSTNIGEIVRHVATAIAAGEIMTKSKADLKAELLYGIDHDDDTRGNLLEQLSASLDFMQSKVNTLRSAYERYLAAGAEALQERMRHGGDTH